MPKNGLIKKSDTIKRTYDKISPNFPPELEEILHSIVKESTISDIIDFTTANLELYMKLSGNLDKKDLRSLLRFPGIEIEPVSSYALGNYVYNKLYDKGFKEYLLTNDICVFPDWDRWIFRMRSLSTQILRGGLKVYYSTKTPELTIDEKKYRIAFTWHCIERIHERTQKKKYDYDSMGELFAFLNDNNYHEQVELTDGSRALIMYGLAAHEFSITFNVVKAILGNQYYPDDTHYYRLGYFPYEITGDFLVCKTFLCPGFFTTPEYKLLKESPENVEWLKRANENERNDSYSTFDLELIKKLHDLGVPQVKVIKERVYTYR